MILIFMSEQNAILSENLNLSELKRPYWYLQNATEREGVGRNIQEIFNTRVIIWKQYAKINSLQEHCLLKTLLSGIC